MTTIIEGLDDQIRLAAIRGLCPTLLFSIPDDDAPTGRSLTSCRLVVFPESADKADRPDENGPWFAAEAVIAGHGTVRLWLKLDESIGPNGSLSPIVIWRLAAAGLQPISGAVSEDYLDPHSLRGPFLYSEDLDPPSPEDAARIARERESADRLHAERDEYERRVATSEIEMTPLFDD